jgi:hypothetical protein
MNFIEQLVEKYEGKYSEELTKRFYTTGGKITYQPKNGLIDIDGTKIKISFNEAGGIMRSTDPIRVVLFLDKDYKQELSIYPGILLNYITDLIFQPKSLNIPKFVRKQYSFRGDYTLIKKLASDSIFCESIVADNIYITLDRKYPKSLMLTPAYGIYDLEHFENLILILKRIELSIKNKST